jgi:hypothetical protein
MASIISAGTTSGTALNLSGDTTGNLAFTTQAGANTITVPNETGTIITSKTTGTVLQVVNATYTTIVSTSSSTYSDIGLTATITPKFSTSKILIFVTHAGSRKQTNTTTLSTRLLRGSTVINYIDDNGGSNGTTTLQNFGATGGSFLDSPGTTSATTYKTQFASYTNTAAVYINDYNLNNSTSTMTLMEIAG